MSDEQLNGSDALGVTDLEAWMRLAARTVADHEEELTALDAAIGDADHGANMTRGFDAVVEVLDAGGLDTPEALLKKVAMTLISKVGGASGPLYGTFFLRMAGASADCQVLDAAALARCVEAGVAGIAQRGKGEKGEKTMLDAWYPALDALASPAGSLSRVVSAAAQAAARGRDATRDLVATKGRASYLGERSVGHIDPGAASTALLLEALAQVVSGGAEPGPGEPGSAGGADSAGGTTAGTSR